MYISAYLFLHFVKSLLRKISRFADIVISTQPFEVDEIISLGCPFSDNGDCRIFEFTLLYSSCHNLTFGNAPNWPFIYARWIDGIKRLPQALSPIRGQMCQFHQMLIVSRYLTQETASKASKKLLNRVKIITNTDKESFIGSFNEWYEKYRGSHQQKIA